MGFLYLSNNEVAEVAEELQRARLEGYNKSAVALCIQSVTPIISKCHNGRNWLKQFEKLLVSENGESAEKLWHEHIARQFKWYVYPAFFLGLPVFVALIAWLVYK